MTVLHRPFGAVSGFFTGDGVLVDGAILTNPADQTVLADTGPLNVSGPAGTWVDHLFAVTGCSNVALVYDIQHRDATNTTNLNVLRRRFGPGVDDKPFANKLAIGPNERLRVILQGSVTGEAQAAIEYTIFT
jgi:hypothetical protein